MITEWLTNELDKKIKGKGQSRLDLKHNHILETI